MIDPELQSRIVGIVGSEGAKFTSETESDARSIIVRLLSEKNVIGVSSGHCHLGGIDMWAEEIGKELGLQLFIFPPKRKTWEGGYKQRNVEIARAATEMHCITLKQLPDSFKGMRFDYCYHCHTKDHVKSGGCWTVKYAQGMGKKGFWHVI